MPQNYRDAIKKAQQEVQELTKKTEERKRISFADLFSDAFVQQHSKFNTMQQFVDEGGIESLADFDGEAWDKFVADQTDFASWDDMRHSAQEEWVRRNLLS